MKLSGNALLDGVGVFVVSGSPAVNLCKELATERLVPMLKREPSPKAILRQIQASVLVTGELGVRPRLSLEEWEGLSAEERQPYWDVGINAVRSVDHRMWSRRITALGAARFAPAVPTLIDLWERCPVQPVRQATGHALYAIGTDDARDVLRRGLNDHDYLNRFLALKVLWTDAGSAWDNVSWVLGANRLSSPVGIAIGSEALSFLHPSSWSARGATWHIDGLNEHVQRDERWLDLLVSIRHDADIGRAARSALWHMDRSIVDPLLDAAAHHDADELAAEPHPPAVVPGALVRRYEAGDHDAVWRELRSVVRLDAAWRNEAHALAMATMERVRRNAERLVTALADAGWPLNRETAISAPPNDLEARLATIESLTGSPCPPSAVAFWRVVGGIRLVPELEPWPPNIPYALAELDPLEVADPASVWFAVDEWQEGSASAHPELAGPIELPIAADHLHKANISGGPPYALWLPDNGADPIVREEPHRLPFTDYLRHVFRNSGFALLSERPDEEAQRWVASLDYVYEPF